MTRRQALGAGLLSAVWWASSKSALAQASFQTEPTHDNALVVLFLRGGCDGLNMVAPYQEDAYYRLRPNIAISTTGPNSRKLHDLDGFYGLHPSLRSLMPAWREGDFGIVHAVGSNDTTRSHFSAMTTMERGLDDPTGGATGGWLARFLNAHPGTTSPLRAVSFSDTMPASLSGSQAVALRALATYGLQEDVDRPWAQALAKLYEKGDDAMAQAGRDTLGVLKALNAQNPDEYRPSHDAQYPDTDLGRAFRDVAFMVRNDLGLEVACLESDGWDTHVTQGGPEGWHAGLLTEVGEAIAAFRQDMGQDMKRVTVLVQSEFGRRVAENQGLGTDHGTGGAMLLVGGGVQGGKVHGRWPGLDNLIGPGDLQVTTDYRDVLAETLAHRLNAQDMAAVFGDHTPRPLGVVV